MTDTLNNTHDADVCARVIATMAAPVYNKIRKAFTTALDQGYELLTDDGRSPVGEIVMAQMNADLARLGWGPDAVRAMRLNVRVIGMTLIRERYEIRTR
jgi:hypothetical protein